MFNKSTWQAIDDLDDKIERLSHSVEGMKHTIKAVDERLSFFANQVKDKVVVVPAPEPEPEPERDLNQPVLVKELWDTVNAYIESKEKFQARIRASTPLSWLPSHNYEGMHLQQKLDALFRDLVLRQGPHPDATRPEGV